MTTLWFRGWAGWPFLEAPRTVVFTTREVLEGAPILFVSHDGDDGAWQFHSHDPATEETASVTTLLELARLDPSIGELASLPVGWCAWRQTREAPWARKPSRG